MQIELDGESYAVTTGGYESPIPSNAILDLEEAKYQSRSWKGSFSSDQVDLADIYSSNIWVVSQSGLEFASGALN